MEFTTESREHAGEVGTVVEELRSGHFFVEIADEDGRTTQLVDAPARELRVTHTADPEP